MDSRTRILVGLMLAVIVGLIVGIVIVGNNNDDDSPAVTIESGTGERSTPSTTEPTTQSVPSGSGGGTEAPGTSGGTQAPSGGGSGL